MYAAILSIEWGSITPIALIKYTEIWKGEEMDSML